MQIKIALIICVICTLNGTTALTITEDIAANGGGKLTCRTSTPVAEDQVEASGIQTYSLLVKQDIEKGTASLTSKYSLNIPHNVSPKRKIANVSPNKEFNSTSLNTTSVSITQTIINIGNTAPIDNTLANNLEEIAIQKGDSPVNVSEETLKIDLPENASINKNNNLPIYPRSFKIKSSPTGKFYTPDNISEDHSSEDSSQNRYGIKMIYPNHLMHRAEVSGADNFTAENTITFDGKRVTTDYKMQGKGILEGSVMASSKLGRLHPVTRTKIEDSNFTIHSGVEDKAKLVSDSDIEKLSNDVEDTAVGSEEKQDESKNVDYYDLLDNQTVSPDAIYFGLASGKFESKETLYWFTWEDINESELKKVLKDNLGYMWVGKESEVKEINDTSISVMEDGKIINLTFDGNKLILINGSEELDIFRVIHKDTVKGNVHEIHIPIEYDVKDPAYKSKQDAASKTSGKTDSGSQSNQGDASKTSGMTDSGSQTNQGDASKTSGMTDSGSQLKLGDARIESSLAIPVIPGPIFGLPLNSTFIDRTLTNSNYSKKTVYIGRYKPPQDTNFGMVTGNYSANVTEGIYAFEKVNATGPTRKYLNIRYGDSRIRIRSTPPGTRFSIYKGPI
ncbi:MAG: hypothetical protein PHS80_01645 [Methanothrix sp.]|nr:hypothetical protein [Methanothrix sp.]MDD4446231.1 hypothetical protein [Methanothrix sp.]